MNPVILSANVPPCRTGVNYFNQQVLNGVTQVLFGANPRRWAVVPGIVTTGNYTLKFGDVVAANAGAALGSGLLQQPLGNPIPLTHELLGSSLHEEVTISNNVAAQFFSFAEIMLVDYPCPVCYPEDYARFVAQYETWERAKASGYVDKKQFGYTDDYTSYTGWVGQQTPELHRSVYNPSLGYKPSLYPTYTGYT